jgi:hypothetical protein
VEGRRLSRLSGGPQEEADDERRPGTIRPLDDVAGKGRREGLGEDEREKDGGGLDRRHGLDILKVERDLIDVSEVGDADEKGLWKKRHKQKKGEKKGKATNLGEKQGKVAVFEEATRQERQRRIPAFAEDEETEDDSGRAEKGDHDRTSPGKGRSTSGERNLKVDSSVLLELWKRGKNVRGSRLSLRERGKSRSSPSASTWC